MHKDQDLRARLAEQTLLASSSDELIAQVAAYARVTHYKSGAYVSLEGDAESGLLLILSGQLRVCGLSAKGDEIPITTASAGGSLGAVSIISNTPCIGNVIANCESTVAMLGRKFARQLLAEPSVALQMNGLLASLVERLIHSQNRNGLPRAAARVAAVIVEELDRARDANAIRVQPPSHATIAAMAKVSRETVSRVLSSLELGGMIAKEGRHIRILDGNALRLLGAR
jgi:CRP/FNR family transcriptional regulator, cyclic AMP receptor protein